MNLSLIQNTKLSDKQLGYIDETEPYDDSIQSTGVLLNPTITAGPEDGPVGYHFHGTYPKLSEYIDDSEQRSVAIGSFVRNTERYQTISWGQHVLETIGKSFGKISLKAIGNGGNSNAFVMEQQSSGHKFVLRTFPIFNLRHPHLQTAFQLNKENVGGEWLSATFNHDNLAHNSHIVIWDSFDNSFKVMNQAEVRALIEMRGTLEKGRQIYAVATIGDYIEGSQDLEKIMQSVGKKTEEEIRPILRDIFSGVAAMNKNEIVHRDLKAENIIILPSGQAKIIDFGSAAILQTEGTLPFHGDRRVHPPESFFAPIHTSSKTDSFSVFLLIYRGLTGDNFFGKASKVADIRTEHEKWITKQSAHSFQALLQDDPKLAGVSPALIDLMSQLGTANEGNRLSPEQTLTHPFFATHEVTHLKDSA